jgi:hypothetical protein
MKEFVSGALCLGFWVAALFFLRFYRMTRDRLFAVFSLSFLLMGVNRALTALIHQDEVQFPYFYLIRLVAYLLIIYAIVDKNRQPTVPPREG